MSPYPEFRYKVLQYTGIPVSIGISYSKTLAKVASLYAKKNAAGVYALLTDKIIEKTLKQTRVGDIWGIGSKLREKLEWLGINSAKQLREIDSTVLSQFSVVMHRLVQELWGNSCLALEEITARKSITYSKSFSYKVTKLEELQEAISEYAAKACEKLRAQNSLVKEIYIFAELVNFKIMAYNISFM